jgi:purine nucleoside phosphorylase
MHPSFIPYRKAGVYLAKRLEQAGMESPEVGIVCGSGLSGLSNALEGKTLTVGHIVTTLIVLQF